ncbi:hypothetical protein M0R45_016343 [Rubus argutus]|uniref:Uncharacterized protein n=1 Tax=Rubus argutus TaxID=59490 RepID=A0AAW1XSI4_RUBAR
MKSFIPELCSQLYIEGLCHGICRKRALAFQIYLKLLFLIELYFQIEREVGIESTRLRALIDLFDEIVEEPLFNQLRTKEQLGYTVHVAHVVDNFINGLEELLVRLDADSFENYRAGLMAKLLEKDPSLTYESNRFWNQITDKRYIFDYAKKEAEELKSIQRRMSSIGTKHICNNHLPSVADLQFVFGVATPT